MLKCPAEVHVGDVGTVFEATIKDGDNPVDVSGLDLLELIFEKPDGTIFKRVASLTTDGTDGKVRYVSQRGDVTHAGRWRWQAHAADPADPEQDWRTEVLTFPVSLNLESIDPTKLTTDVGSLGLSAPAVGILIA